MENFEGLLGPECHDLFHQNYNCMFRPNLSPAGPFLEANWSIFVLHAQFESWVMWMMQHRLEYSVLVHPNTGCELEDHIDWAIWGGQPYQLDTSTLSHDQPFPWPQKSETEKIIQ